MSKIKDIKVSPLSEKSEYIELLKMEFSLNGYNRSWDIVKVKDSVSVLIYDIDIDSFVLVKQFRPALYLRNGDGYSIELCAGLVDKDKSLKNIAKEEVFEECGYDAKTISKITSLYSSMGMSSSIQTLFYTIVKQKDLVGSGGGIVGEEDIEIIYIKSSNIYDFLYDESIPKGTSIFISIDYFMKNIYKMFK